MALAEHMARAIHKLSEMHSKKTGGKKSHVFKGREEKKEFTNKEGEKKKHVGFKGAEDSVEREGYSKEIAGKIIGARSRGASEEEKKKNPRLNKVK